MLYFPAWQCQKFSSRILLRKVYELKGGQTIFDNVLWHGELQLKALIVCYIQVLSSSTVPSVVDLSTKVRQDPLFLIKQKEEAAKKVLASNPVKMKQLKQVCLFKYMSF